MRIFVAGAGAWGTALAMLLEENGHAVTLWTRNAEKAREIDVTRQNPALAGVTLQLLRGALEDARIPQARRALTVDSLAGLVAGFALNSTGIAVIDAIDDHRFPSDPDAERRLRELLAGVPWEPL